MCPEQDGVSGVVIVDAASSTRDSRKILAMVDPVAAESSSCHADSLAQCWPMTRPRDWVARMYRLQIASELESLQTMEQQGLPVR